MRHRGLRKFRGEAAAAGSQRALLDALERRVMLATAAQFIDYQTTTPLPYASYVPQVVGDQLVFGDAGDADSNNYQSGEVYNIDTGRWTTQQFDHRLGYAAAVVGDKAIFAGGNTATISDTEYAAGSDQVDIYDADTGQWSSAQLSSARINITTVTVGDKAIFAGGSAAFSDGPNPPLRDVDIYDSTTGQWSTASLSFARDGFAAAAVDGKALFAGGYEYSGSAFQPSKVVDVFNSVNNQWSTMQMPEGIVGSAGVSVGDDAVFAGISYDESAQLPNGNQVEVYNAETNEWSVASLSETRVGFTAVSVGNEAIFAGGSYETRNGRTEYPSDYVDIFHADTGKWTVGHMPVAMEYPYPTTLGDDVVFTGSVNGPYGFSSIAEIYDSTSGRWSVLPLATASFSPIVLSAGGRLFFSSPNFEGDNPTYPFEAFSATNLRPPGSDFPASGSVLGVAPTVIRWTPTTGATGYDVYVDGRLAGSAVDNRWALSVPQVEHGGHSYSVVAHVNGGTVSGATSNYFVQGLDVVARIQDPGVSTDVLPRTTGMADITVEITNLSAIPSSIVVGVGAQAVDTSGYYLGGKVEPFGAKDVGRILHFEIPITVPRRIGVGLTYQLVVTVTLNGTTYYPYWGPRAIVAVGALPQSKGVHTGGVWQF